jgi:TonB family protein
MLTFLLSLILQTQLLVNFLPGGVEKSLRNHVNYITADSLMGRAPGSAGELAVAKYIHSQLEVAGVTILSPHVGEDFYINDTINGKKTMLHTRNVIGVVEGFDSSMKNEYVVIGAHIDNNGINRLNVNGKEVLQIFPGADGNASGVAVLIELAKQIQQQKFLFRRSIIFAFFGAGEESCAGSWYFLNRSFKESDKIVMMLNLNNVGRSGGENGFQIFTGIHNMVLNAIIKDLADRPATIIPILSSVDYEPSDHRMFYQNEIPIALFTTGRNHDLHTVRDTPDKLDYNQMVGITEFAMAFVQNIANRDNRVSGNTSLKGKKIGAAGTIYNQYETDLPATFFNGNEMQFLTRWVYKYLKYPDSAVRDGIRGRVVVDFTINEDGNLTDAVITKGLSEEIDAEVLKVINASPKWKAAKLNGSKVKVKISIPVDFKLASRENRGTFKIKR